MDRERRAGTIAALVAAVVGCGGSIARSDSLAGTLSDADAPPVDTSATSGDPLDATFADRISPRTSVVAAPADDGGPLDATFADHAVSLRGRTPQNHTAVGPACPQARGPGFRPPRPTTSSFFCAAARARTTSASATPTVLLVCRAAVALRGRTTRPTSASRVATVRSTRTAARGDSVRRARGDNPAGTRCTSAIRRAMPASTRPTARARTIVSSTRRAATGSASRR